MPVSGSTEFDVAATPGQVMDALAAVEELPQRSGSVKAATVETRHPDGRPHRIRAQVGAAGLTDEEIKDYTWCGLDEVTWTLVSSSLQSEQSGSYRLRPTATGTHVRFDLTIGVKVPMPGFVLKRILKSALDEGSSGLKAYVEGRAAR